MKIEFRCLHCQRLLRVPAAHRGDWVVCPACHNAVTVPDPQFDPAASHWQVTDSAEVFELVWEPQAVSLSSILQDTWAIYVQNLGKLLVVTLVDLLLWIVGIFLIVVPAVGTFAVLQKAVGIPVPLSMLAMFFVLLLGFMYLVNAMTCSQTKFFLKVARGEPTSILDAFHIGWKPGAITMLPTVFAAISLSGLMLCVVPGVCVYLFFWPYIWIWADRQTGGQDAQAFPLARDLSSRNIPTSLTIAAIGIAMTVVGLNLFGQSLFGILKAVAYLRMSGQEVTGLIRRQPVQTLALPGVDPT